MSIREPDRPGDHDGPKCQHDNNSAFRKNGSIDINRTTHTSLTNTAIGPAGCGRKATETAGPAPERARHIHVCGWPARPLSALPAVLRLSERIGASRHRYHTHVVEGHDGGSLRHQP